MNRKLQRMVCIMTFLAVIGEADAQGSQTNRLTKVKRTNSRIVVDGLLDDSLWNSIPVVDSFINKWPTDNGKARLQTQVRIAYDEQFIYFGIKAFLSDKPPVIQSLKRDINPYYSDGISIVIDPSNKNTSGYTFGVNAAGAQMDGIVQVNSASFDWDTKWYSGTQIYNGYWTAELAIPFKSIRFPDGQTQWGINFIRNDMTNNCFSTWNQVPVQFFGANLNCLGKIEFADDIPRVKNNNAFIPYVSSKTEQIQGSVSLGWSAGIDAKIALNSSMNLDITLNPDFSQVDVDRQIINLDRFNVLLPERRTFFLENSDLFSNLGLENAASPFVSRTIGLTQDGRIVPIIAGLRLTGNINPSLRIGIMNIQSAAKYGQPPQNYTVAAFDHKIFKRSNIRGIVTNRQEVSGAEKKGNGANYNRVAGAEFDFLSNNTKFNGRFGYYYSFNPGSRDSSGFGLASIGYTDKSISVSAGWTRINSNFITDLGFTPRLYNYDAANDTTWRIGYNDYTGGFDYTFYPRSKKTINSIDFGIKTNQYYTTFNEFIEFNGTAGLDVLFANRREASVSWTQNIVNLPFETAIFPETGNLPKAKYSFGFLQLKFQSNFLRAFSWGLIVEHGGYYNGKRTTYLGNLKYRSQPWGNFGIDFSYNSILLNGIKIHPFIIGPTVEFAFTNNLFWTTFIQYNSEIKNFNLNSRLQWRFKPGSDIFIVYTDNYQTNGFNPQGRSLVLKINYWIN